jgi:hypothetical protein
MNGADAERLVEASLTHDKDLATVPMSQLPGLLVRLTRSAS